ncbi:hypothetical protein C8R46DRAFT_1228435 [Mycena filopes]|nr:hypothetical protein C8R46DRAFT_1228435 [Mycena filopes]
MPKKRLSNNSFTFCDTVQGLSVVAASLRGSSTLFLDCEGHDLGLVGGGLSLISLGTPTPTQPRTFLIDAIALSTADLRPIFDLLESPHVKKVVFDGRMDQTALYYEHGGVRLQNVVDLQLADIKSRVLRGESEGSLEQLMRLSPYLLQSEVQANPRLYHRVQKLPGLEQTVREHGVAVGAEELNIKGRFKHTTWLRRPLSQTALIYAANDITLIAHLWEEFVDQGYIDGKLADQSLRYIRLWTSSTGPQINADHRYRLHALLPLEILDDDAVSVAGEHKKLCPRCERLLPQRCFSTTAWNREANRKCFVCRAIGIRIIKQGLGAPHPGGLFSVILDPMRCPKSPYDKAMAILNDEPFKSMFELRKLQGREADTPAITANIATMVQETEGGPAAVQAWLKLVFDQRCRPRHDDTVFFVDFFWCLAMGLTEDATALINHRARRLKRTRKISQASSPALPSADEVPTASGSGLSNDGERPMKFQCVEPTSAFSPVNGSGKIVLRLRVPAPPQPSILPQICPQSRPPPAEKPLFSYEPLDRNWPKVDCGTTKDQDLLRRDSSRPQKVPPRTTLKKYSSSSDDEPQEFPTTFPKLQPVPLPPTDPTSTVAPSPSASGKCEDHEMVLSDAASESSQYVYTWPDSHMGFPPVWSASRQELCETLPWFRSFHGGVYQNSGVAKGYLLGGFGSEGDCFRHGGKLIVSHGGGGGNESGGIHARVNDQRGGDRSVRALINNCIAGTPVVLVVDENYTKFPLKLSTKGISFAVLGFYIIVAAWAESRRVNETDCVRYKFAFQWCDGQGPPWWIQDSQESPDPPEYTPQSVYQCSNCGNSSPRVFKHGWTCLRPDCPQFWTGPNWQLSAALEYNPEFLELREPLALRLAPEFDTRLVPPPPVFDSTEEFTTGFKYTRGWYCQKCGRMSSRESLKCEDSLPRAFMGTDFKITDNSGIVPLAAQTYYDTAGGWGIRQSFVLPEKRGTIHHMRGSDSLNGEAGWILEEYQKQATSGALLFRRHPLKKHLGRGQLLSSYFSQNIVSQAGEAYQYVGGSAQTVPLQDACPAVQAAHRLIETRVASALGAAPPHPFNELLSVAYLEKQSMAYHSDNERGLGPVVAGLSLGSPAVMNFRVATKRLEEGARNRTELSIFLQHGDVLVMDGAVIHDGGRLFKAHCPPSELPDCGDRASYWAG